MKRFSERFFGGNRAEKDPTATNGTVLASTGEPTVVETPNAIEASVDGAEAASGVLLGAETEPEDAPESVTAEALDENEAVTSDTSSSEQTAIDAPAPKLPLLGQASVQVKGWRNGLLLYIPTHGEWDDVLADVDARLDEARARSFWRGAQTTIICGIRAVSLGDLTVLCDHIKEDWGLVPVAVVATDSATRAAGEKLVLDAYKELPVSKPAERRERSEESRPTSNKLAANNAPPVPPAPISEAPGSNALYLPSTVRSGQRIAHAGHVIVCGDVNAGAEVIATGDVLIFGTLRGLAHAGSGGNEAARIIATNLRPQQLRIAAKIARAPEEPKKGSGGAAQTPRPEVARIENGEIGVFPL